MMMCQLAHLVVNRLGEIIGSGKNLREKVMTQLLMQRLWQLKMLRQKIDNWRFDDLTMVVTLRAMCNVCWRDIVQAQDLKRLVFGAFDEKAGAVGIGLWM